jgi:eukaryotic-like serine/threonine-protein kinase
MEPRDGGAETARAGEAEEPSQGEKEADEDKKDREEIEDEDNEDNEARCEAPEQVTGMADRTLIGPEVPVTPPDAVQATGRRQALPPDLVREASQRLGVMALLGGALWIVGLTTDQIILWATRRGRPRGSELDIDYIVTLILVVVSFVLYRYTRKQHRDPRHMLDLGLGYMILTAVAIGIIFHWSPIPSEGPIFPMFSWIGIVVLIFAAIIPSSPGKTFVAALISVSMNPIGMWIARARGTWDFGSNGNILIMHYPDYILVGVAVVISSVYHRLRQQVVRAREMGSYQLEELLGRGGMGEVYRASHRMLARPAAIKLIRPDAVGGGDSESTQLAVKRFRREAEAAANLRSPHTVELYDFGVTEDGTFYFVMELLVGMDLDSLVRKCGPVKPGRVIHILKQVCESLEEAHASGLVHRDIKPANIHVGRLGLRHDFVKVLDFGLVKAAKDTGSDGHSMETAAGLTPGTPAYMAPEMAMGETVDGRTDIYALGCVAYFLLTGRPVFEAESAIRMVAQHLQSEPVPPSRRSELEVPPELDRIILQCLAKRPEDRPQTAAALSKLLEQVPVEPWGEESAREWWRLHQGT